MAHAVSAKESVPGGVCARAGKHSASCRFCCAARPCRERRALAGFGLSRRNGEYETWVDSVKTKQRNWGSVGSRSRGRVQCSCYLGVLIVHAVRDAQS